MIDHDPFADLLGPPAPADGASKSESIDDSDVSVPPLLDTMSGGAVQVGAPASKPVPSRIEPNMYVMLKEDARDYVHDAVKEVVDDAVVGAVGKLVDRMRDVLSRVVSRIEKMEGRVSEMAGKVAALDSESISATMNQRFTSVDGELKELSRSLQAMRDHAELAEAQQQLAKLQVEDSRAREDCRCRPSEQGLTSRDSGSVASLALHNEPSSARAASEAATRHSGPLEATGRMQCTDRFASQTAPAAGAPPVASAPMVPYQQDPAVMPSAFHGNAPDAPPALHVAHPVPLVHAPRYGSSPDPQAPSSGFPGFQPPPYQPPTAAQVALTHMGTYQHHQQAGQTDGYPQQAGQTDGYPQQPPPPNAPAYQGLSPQHVAHRPYMPLSQQQPPQQQPPPQQQQQAPVGMPPAQVQRGREQGLAQMSTASIINDICQMGFSRSQVEAALQREVAAGRSVDLNAVVDALMSKQP